VRVLGTIAIAVLLSTGCDIRGERKPELLRIPNVVGMKWPDAANRIGAAGLCYRWGRFTLRTPGARVGRVIAQRPPAGQRAARLSEVWIDVEQGKSGRGSASLYLTEQSQDCPDPGLPVFAGSP